MTLKPRDIPLLMALVVVITAIIWTVKAPLEGTGSANSSASSVTTSSGSVSGLPSYTAYREGQSIQGPAVLFFHAFWDPFSARNDDTLKAMNASGALRLPVIKIDFDTALELKLKYAVVTQDTFIKLNAREEKLMSIVHPSKEELETILAE